jgi:hypothetical protein
VAHGGCPEQNLAAQFASTTRTFCYRFDDWHAPGLNMDLPGYQWCAGHAVRSPASTPGQPFWDANPSYLG